MPDYDAFGRELGEDTLAQWRSGSTALPPQPPAEAAVQAPPVAAEAAAPSSAVTAGDPLGVPHGPVAPPPPRTHRRPRVRRRGARLGVLLVLAWVGLTLIGSLVDRVEDAARTLTVPRLTPPGPAAAPVGLEPGSLLRPAALRRALADLGRRDIGRVQTLRLAPERIDASLLTPRGTIVSVQLTAGGGFRRFAESGAGFGNLDTIRPGRLDPRAPERLTRAAAKRLGVAPDRIDYLVPTLVDDRVTWGAYFKGGAIFLADARGRITRRLP